MEYTRTFREVFKNPENVIDNFILKEKSKFQHPFSFGLMGVIIIILLNSVFVDFNTAQLVGFLDNGDDQMSQLNYWIEYAQLKVSTQFLPLTLFLLLIPSLTLPGLYFFREDIEGFYYNLILNSYSIGASVVALMILIPVWMIEPSTTLAPMMRSYLPLVLNGFLIVFIYKQYFLINDLKGWIRILSSYITGCIIFFFLKSFCASTIGYFIFAVNRFLDIWGSI